MADLSLKEKLQRSLLDRLIDDAPRDRAESRQTRVQTVQNLRANVLRDLEWLMNTENMESVDDLKAFPNVASSVVNYGMPALAGSTLSAVDVADIERRMARAIRNFEPRIIPQSLRVRASYSEDESSHNSLTFEIAGDLWASPVPLKLFLRTQVDLETGDIRINPITEA